MMGADSVGYHERTVLGREDDPVGNALEYYASRGETPMAWGGAGAARLGLEGEVDLAEWNAVFGTGGARHSESGERLVHCLRPGMELVVSPHKSIAELGVIGRAEDMHKIVDAERDATMAYLDEVVQDEGGRRGRAQQKGSHGRCPAMRQREPVTPRSTIMCWSQIWSVWLTKEAGGKRWTPGCSATTSTPPPLSAAWRGLPRPWNSGTGSKPTLGARGASVAGPSPVFPNKPGRYTPTARPRSKRP